MLKSILLHADNHGLQLTSNNLELGIQTSKIDAGTEQSGSVALDARLFSDIVKKLPDDYIQIAVDEKNVTMIRCGKAEFKILGNEASEFPILPNVDRNHKFTIKQNVLRDMIRRTIFSVSEMETKPVFTGELIEIKDGLINIVAVDGFRIAYCYNETVSPEQAFKVIVPGKSMGEFVKLLSGSEESEANIYFTDKHILFELDTCTIVSRLLEGDFLDYSKTFISDYSTLVKLDRSELLASLDRATLVSVEGNKKTPVKLDIQDETVTITSTTEKGAVHEEIVADIDGKDLTIAFNPKYLIDALKAIEHKEVAIQYVGELSPCIIRPVEEGNYKYLILPLRLKN